MVANHVYWTNEYIFYHLFKMTCSINKLCHFFICCARRKCGSVWHKHVILLMQDAFSQRIISCRILPFSDIVFGENMLLNVRITSKFVYKSLIWCAPLTICGWHLQRVPDIQNAKFQHSLPISFHEFLHTCWQARSTLVENF